ncbi:universal stress protein [Paractinoplanes rishiriensis]|uniref:Universal stress protein n=1 Tax=Paractinoplanes rishiriensis TaxID=1050105 RepID=A0A919K9T1_9ACTN|nr:universal stress protein [Actinoplanes rishiriensis]GIF02420.1 universal stress protein [Actinoplanes rishiriensis]
MSKPVVIGFDGSAAADAAVQHAAREAAQRDTELRLVHAFGWAVLLPPMTPPYDDSEHGPRAAALDLLDRTAHGVRGDWPQLTVTTRLIDGSPGAVLVDASRDAQLVAVGHRGIGGFAGLLAGSTAMQIAGHATCPVTVVRGTTRPENAPIVLGMDGSTHAFAAAEVAFATAQRQGVELVLIYHDPTPSQTQPDAVTAQVEQLAQRFSDVKYRRDVAQGTTAATALIDAADRWNAGMIIVGSRGRGGFRGLITGSTSRALIEHANCPVTIAPAVAQ